MRACRPEQQTRVVHYVVAAVCSGQQRIFLVFFLALSTTPLPSRVLYYTSPSTAPDISSPVVVLSSHFYPPPVSVPAVAVLRENAAGG